MTTPTVESLQKEIDALKKEVFSIKGSKKEKVPRKPTPFNIYMKEQIPIVKAQNPTMKHSEAFTIAAKSWQDHKK